MIKYLGCGALLILSAVVSKKYKSYTEGKIKHTEAFLEFLLHIRQSLKTALVPQHLLHQGFSCKVLEGDFLPYLRECGELSSAYSKCGNLSGATSGKILLSYFSSFGGSDRDGELERVDDAISSLKEALASERDEGEKNVKLFTTLSISLAVGLIILLI